MICGYSENLSKDDLTALKRFPRTDQFRHRVCEGQHSLYSDFRS